MIVMLTLARLPRVVALVAVLVSACILLSSSDATAGQTTADLSAFKIHSFDPVAGAAVSYTISVVNDGPDAAAMF